MKNTILKLTSKNTPIKKEVWPICPCCGEPGLNCAEAKGLFSEGESWPVKHIFEGTTTVFKDEKHVQKMVDKALNLIRLMGDLDAEENGIPLSIFPHLLSERILERSEGMNQLLHTVHDFEVMLTDLFGDRKEVKDDSIVWAFAYIIYCISTHSSHNTGIILHTMWNLVMFNQTDN